MAEVHAVASWSANARPRSKIAPSRAGSRPRASGTLHARSLGSKAVARVGGEHQLSLEFRLVMFRSGAAVAAAESQLLQG